MNGRVGAEEARPPIASKRFYNFLVIFFILLEPLSNAVGRLNNQAHLFLASLIQWVRICAGKFGQQAPSRYKWKVKSKNLVTGRFLGQGCSGIFYETTLAGSHFRKVRLVRKLFPGVKGDIFESEVVRLFELNHHPMIVKTFWWTVDNRSCSLVMEYVRDNLCSVMRKRKEALRKESASSQQLVTGTTSPAPFQLPEAIDLVLQIAKGMQHLHDGGVIHGDLKPNNILIEWEEGRMLVKLADFGLIETKRRTTLVSQRALFSQMIKWSAPELFEDYFASMSEDMEFLWTTSLTRSDTSSSSASNTKNGPEILMEKVDSYSFALTCVYILGGQIMWNGKLSPNELREKILNSDSRPELPLGCPRKLKSLILECWDVDPTLRPTFSVICEKLEEIVKEQETQLDSSDKLQDNVKEQDSELDICCTITSYRSIDMACSSLDLGGHAFAVSTNGVIQPCQIPMLQLPEEEVDAVANPQTFQPPPGALQERGVQAAPHTEDSSLNSVMAHAADLKTFQEFENYHFYVDPGSDTDVPEDYGEASDDESEMNSVNEESVSKTLTWS